MRPDRRQGQAADELTAVHPSVLEVTDQVGDDRFHGTVLLHKAVGRLSSSGQGRSTSGKVPGGCREIQGRAQLTDYSFNGLDRYVRHFPLWVAPRIVGGERDGSDFHLGSKRL